MMLLNRAPLRKGKLNQSSFQIALVSASSANIAHYSWRNQLALAIIVKMNGERLVVRLLRNGFIEIRLTTGLGVD